MAYSGTFGAITANVWPGPNPRAASPPAKRRMASRSSAKVSVRPVAPSISAARSGISSTLRRTWAVIVVAGISTSGSGLV